jgi:hypothetical protein
MTQSLDFDKISNREQQVGWPAKLQARLLIKRARAGIHSSHADLIDDANLQVAINAVLTGEPHVVGKFGLHRQTIALKLAHWAKVSFENLDTAGGATGIAAAAVKNIDASVFENQHQFLSFWRVNCLRSSRNGGFNLRHSV